jgi:hypothetical protein
MSKNAIDEICSPYRLQITKLQKKILITEATEKTKKPQNQDG